MKHLLRLDRTKTYLNMPVNVVSETNIEVKYCINDRYIRQIQIPAGKSCLFESFKESGIHTLSYVQTGLEITENIYVENAVCLGSSVIKRRYIFDEDNIILIQRADRLEIFDIESGQYIYSQLGLYPEKISRVSAKIYQFTTQERFISFFSVDDLNYLDELQVDKLISDKDNLLVYQIDQTVYTYDKSKRQSKTCIIFKDQENSTWVKENTLLAFDAHHFISVDLLSMKSDQVDLENIVCICEDGCIIKYVDHDFWYLDGIRSHEDMTFIKLNITIPEADQLTFTGKYTNNIDNGRVMREELANLKNDERYDEKIEIKKICYSFKNIIEGHKIIYYQYDTIREGYVEKIGKDTVREQISSHYSKSLHLFDTTIYNFEDYRILKNGDCLYYKRGYEPEKPGAIQMIKADGLYYQRGSNRAKMTDSPEDEVKFLNANCISITTEAGPKVIIYDTERNYVRSFEGYDYISKGKDGFYLSKVKETSYYQGVHIFKYASIGIVKSYGKSYSQYLSNIYHVDSIQFFPQGDVIGINGKRKIHISNQSYVIPDGNISGISSTGRFVTLDIDGITQLYDLSTEKFVPYEEFNEYYDYAEISPSGRYVVYRKNQHYYIHDFVTNRDEQFETDRFIEFSSDDNLIFEGEDKKTYRRALINNLDSLETIDSNRYKYYTFRSPDHKLFALTKKETRHRNKITNKAISPLEYNHLKQKYSYPISTFGKAPKEIESERKTIRENRRSLYEANKEYFDSHYPKLKYHPEEICLSDFIENFNIVFIGACAKPDNLYEIEIAELSFLNYIAFSYDNKYVGIVGKPGDRGYIHVAQINYNEEDETISIIKNVFTRILGIKMATWYCSFNKLGTFAAYDSTPITYLFLPETTTPITKEGRSLLCMSKSGKYIALSTHSYKAISCGGTGHQPSTYVEIVSGNGLMQVKEVFNCGEEAKTYKHDDPYKKNVVMAAFTDDDKKLMVLRKDHVILIKFLNDRL